MARVPDRHGAEKLHALRDRVDELILLAGVLVHQKVQLVEGGAAHQPMGLLVEVVEDAPVAQHLVQARGHLGADVRVQAERHRA